MERCTLKLEKENKSHLMFNKTCHNNKYMYALIILGVATIVEIIAYFIPYIDNLLDTISVPLAALAGTAIMLSTESPT